VCAEPVRPQVGVQTVRQSSPKSSRWMRDAIPPGGRGGAPSPRGCGAITRLPRRDSLGDWAPETMRVGQTVEEQDRRSGPDCRDRQRRPPGRGAGRRARRGALTDGHVGATRRGQELLAETGHETRVGPTGFVIDARVVHGCLTRKYGRGLHEPCRVTRRPISRVSMRLGRPSRW
jgi:hypothetical protein